MTTVPQVDQLDDKKWGGEGAGAYLSMCPVVTRRHAAVGLLLAGLQLAAAAAGGRFAPEPLNFAADVLAGASEGARTLLLPAPSSVS